MSTSDEQKAKLFQKILTYPLIEHPLMPAPDEEQRRQMIENVGAEEVMRLFLMREQRVKAELSDPHRYGNELASWPDADQLLNKNSELLVLGGNRCLAGETVLTDAKTGKKMALSSITEPFWVKALSKDGAEVICQAEVPFTKSPAPLFSVETSCGASFACSEAHLLLCADGEWRPLGLLPVGSQLYPAPSSSGSFLARFRQGAQRYLRKAVGFLAGCLERSHSCGELLLRYREVVQASFPSQACVAGHGFSYERTCPDSFGHEWHLQTHTNDALGGTQECNQPLPSLGRLSSSYGLLQTAVQFSDTLCHASCRLFESASLGCLIAAQSILEFFLRLSIRAFSLLGRCIGFSCAGIVLRKTYLRNDVVWDFTVPEHHNYIHEGVTHHNSGKTEYAAKRMAQAFVGTDLNGFAPDWIKEKFKKRGLNIWCLHTTNMTSVSMQQNVFHKYLPTELKEAKRSKSTQVSWTQKNGFSDNTAVYNGNQIWFLNYSQDIKVVEGGEVDFVWCDELVPADWLETLKYRLITRNGKLLVTFTPILGYTQTVKEFISTSRIKTWKESELLPHNNVIGVPKGHMPYTAEGVYGKHACIWFHSKLNPYNNWERMQQTLKGRSTHDIKIRAYGWAEQTAGSQFPMFGDRNIFTDSVTDHCPEGTNYMVADPAGARNWFMLWARVDAHGTVWVYREWPDQSYGEWALPSDKADGRPGPAQRSGSGRGINEYTELVWSLETHDDKREDIAERYIDPRSAGTETTSKEGGVTLLDLLLDATEPLYFLPAASVSVDERVLIINDLLCYDRDADIDVEKNHPRLMVHENCHNLIYSLREWTGHDGQKGACKDPIDALGYLVVMQPSHTVSSKNQWQKFNKCGSY